MDVFVKGPKGADYPVTIQPSFTGLHLKQALQEKANATTDSMRLMFSGREVADDTNLAQSGVTAGSIIILAVKQAVTSSSSAPSEPLAASAGVKSSSSSAEPKAPTNKQQIEKCWSAAYCEEWDKAKEFLEQGVVSLEELEARTKRDLKVFFAERGIVDALRYIIAKQGKPSVSSTLSAVNLAVKQGRMNSFMFFLDEVASPAELEAEAAGLAQPLHYAVRYGHIDMTKVLLDRGANPNYYAEQGGEFLVGQPGTPIHTVALFGTTPSSADCLDLIYNLPGTDVNARYAGTGDNALHLLAKKDWCESEDVTTLIKLGVDYDALNNEGKRPEDCMAGKSREMTKDFMRVITLARKGKIKPRQRHAADAAEEPDTKRPKTDTVPLFHTLKAKKARLGEWTRELGEDEEDDEGEMRTDEGAQPLTQAIQTDLAELAAGDSAVANAAKLALEIEGKLEGVQLMTETDSDWIPFLIEVPANLKLSFTEAIKQAIRAPNSDLITKKASKSMIVDLFDEGEQERGEELWTFLQDKVTNLNKVKFPEEAICYPVFIGGKVAVNNERYAIVGVFAIRVDT